MIIASGTPGMLSAQYPSYDPFAITLGKVPGMSIVQKFGLNLDIDAAEDIWDGGGDYTGFPLTTLETLAVTSSSVADTSDGTGARTLRVFGLDGSYVEQQEDIILNGQTPVISANTYRRVNRAIVLTSGSGFTNAGNITVSHSTTTANIFTVVLAGYAQSQISAFTIPSGKTGYLLNRRVACQDTQANTVIMCLKLRDSGSNTFRNIRQFVITSGEETSVSYAGGLKLDAKTDFVYRAQAVANTNAYVIVAWDLVLVTSGY